MKSRFNFPSLAFLEIWYKRENTTVSATSENSIMGEWCQVIVEMPNKSVPWAKCLLTFKTKLNRFLFYHPDYNRLIQTMNFQERHLIFSLSQAYCLKVPFILGEALMAKSPGFEGKNTCVLALPLIKYIILGEYIVFFNCRMGETIPTLQRIDFRINYISSVSDELTSKQQSVLLRRKVDGIYSHPLSPSFFFLDFCLFLSVFIPWFN